MTRLKQPGTLQSQWWCSVCDVNVCLCAVGLSYWRVSSTFCFLMKEDTLTPCLNLLVSSDDKFLSVEQTAFQLFTFCPSGNSNQMQIFNLFIDNIGNDEKCTNARPCEPQILFALELWCAFFISRYNVFNCHTHWALPGALKYMLEKLYANQISNKLN